MYRLERDKELTIEKLREFINVHTADVDKRNKYLDAAYKTQYEILKQQNKASWKPDNRIPVNFAKYMTDTFNGFFLGIPIKITVDDETDTGDKIADYVRLLFRYNSLENRLKELSKTMSVHGDGFLMCYVDNKGNIGIEKLTPIEAFMIYDDSILCNPRFFIRTYTDSEGYLHGSVSDSRYVRYFTDKAKGIVNWDGEPYLHGFIDFVPAVEFKENEEGTGLFETVLPMINAYNKAISEKANDVDYFADAYLKILGTLLTEDEIRNIRDNRVINFDGDCEKLIVEFLQKPNGDETQEHLLDRLERLIYQIAMVANISDDSFGTTSGIALKYKLLAMSNLALSKEGYFKEGLDRLFAIIFSNPITRGHVQADDWVKLNYHFTQNYPANVAEEADIATKLEGVVSKETQLKTLSVVESVEGEMDKIKSEQEEAEDSRLDKLLGGGSNGKEE